MSKYVSTQKDYNTYKLLEDFTTLVDETYMPQEAVRFVFPTEESAFGSLETLIEQGIEEDAILEGQRDAKVGAIVDELQEKRYSLIGEIGASALDMAKDYLEMLSGLKFKDKVSFTLNPSDLVHIHNDHFEGNEKDKGNNIPLTTLDIKRIVDVISFPTAIMYGKEKNSRRNLFYFLMDTGAGTYNLLEIYSDRKGNLSTKTYYKTKKDAAQRVMKLKSSLLPTSETYSGAILSDTKIPQIFELPKVSTRNSLISTEMDADYLSAVERGDMEAELP